jgi:hypothetical protein
MSNSTGEPFASTKPPTNPALALEEAAADSVVVVVTTSQVVVLVKEATAEVMRVAATMRRELQATEDPPDGRRHMLGTVNNNLSTRNKVMANLTVIHKTRHMTLMRRSNRSSREVRVVRVVSGSSELVMHVTVR